MRDTKHYAERVIHLVKSGSYSQAFCDAFIMLRLACESGVLSEYTYKPDTYGFEVSFPDAPMLKHCAREPEIIADIVMRRLA